MVYCAVKVYSVYVMMRQIALRGTSTVSKVSLFSNPFSDIFISLYVNMQIYMPSTDIFIFIMVLRRVGKYKVGLWDIEVQYMVPYLPICIYSRRTHTSNSSIRLNNGIFIHNNNFCFTAIMIFHSDNYLHFEYWC